jgi:hypothetical protein
MPRREARLRVLQYGLLYHCRDAIEMNSLHSFMGLAARPGFQEALRANRTWEIRPFRVMIDSVLL